MHGCDLSTSISKLRRHFTDSSTNVHCNKNMWRDDDKIVKENLAKYFDNFLGPQREFPKLERCFVLAKSMFTSPTPRLYKLELDVRATKIRLNEEDGQVIYSMCCWSLDPKVQNLVILPQELK
jgi:hypothetical protein